MANSKSKHIRLKNRRATQYKQRMKRKKEAAKKTASEKKK